MTNIEKIRQEIDRLKNDYLNRSYTFVPAVMQQLLEFIDSLPDENLSNNLDEAAEKYSNTPCNFGNFVEIEYEFGEPIETIVDDKMFVKDAFKAGAEWEAEQARKEE